MIIGFVISFSLPKLSIKLLNYPETLPEILPPVINSHDDENGTSSKSLQIKGKQRNFNEKSLFNIVLFVSNREPTTNESRTSQLGLKFVTLAKWGGLRELIRQHQLLQSLMTDTMMMLTHPSK